MNINVKFVDTVEEDQSQLDVDAIRSSIVEAADNALQFLDRVAYEYEGDLNISYICGESALGANIILRANYRTGEYQSFSDGVKIMQTWLATSHNINLSDEAVDEFAKQLADNSEEFIASLRHEAPHEFDDETDIFVYKGANIDNLHDLMVHELWHLIESQAGVFKTSEFIHEGTATYVQKKFLGINPDVDNFYIEESSAHALYDLVAKIVKEELDAAEGYASMLFQPEFRKKLSDRVKKEVLPLYFDALDKESPAQQKAGIVNNPHYAAFIQDPSRDNLIAAFRSMGAIKWAEELDSQNLSSYIEHIKRLLEKPTTSIA